MLQGLSYLTRCLPLAVAMGVASPLASAPYEFGPWPEEKAPIPVGRRVAANFVSRPHMPMGKDGVIHYAEVCTWLGALSFAGLSNDVALQTQLEDRMEPLFREEKRLVPVPDHVDYTVFGAVPLALFARTRDMRHLALGEWMALRQWGEPFGDRVEPPAIASTSIARPARWWSTWTACSYLDEKGELREVCAGTGAQNDRQYYLDRPRLVGDFHGQAPVLWCATALLR